MRTRGIGVMPIRSSVVTESNARGHEAVVIDVTDSLSFFEVPEAVEFFEISTAYFGDVEHSFRLISSQRFD